MQRLGDDIFNDHAFTEAILRSRADDEVAPGSRVGTYAIGRLVQETRDLCRMRIL